MTNNVSYTISFSPVAFMEMSESDFEEKFMKDVIVNSIARNCGTPPGNCLELFIEDPRRKSEPSIQKSDESDDYTIKTNVHFLTPLHLFDIREAISNEDFSFLRGKTGLRKYPMYRISFYCEYSVNLKKISEEEYSALQLSNHKKLEVLISDVLKNLYDPAKCIKTDEISPKNKND